MKKFWMYMVIIMMTVNMPIIMKGGQLLGRGVSLFTLFICLMFWGRVMPPSDHTWRTKGASAVSLLSSGLMLHLVEEMGKKGANPSNLMIVECLSLEFICALLLFYVVAQAAD